MVSIVYVKRKTPGPITTVLMSHDKYTLSLYTKVSNLKVHLEINYIILSTYY